MNHTKRIADALEHYLLATKFIAGHKDCLICAAFLTKPKPMKPSIVRTDKELKALSADIHLRKVLANSAEEPEAESDSFRYREAERWKS